VYCKFPRLFESYSLQFELVRLRILTSFTLSRTLSGGVLGVESLQESVQRPSGSPRAGEDLKTWLLGSHSFIDHYHLLFCPLKPYRGTWTPISCQKPWSGGFTDPHRPKIKANRPPTVPALSSFILSTSDAIYNMIIHEYDILGRSIYYQPNWADQAVLLMDSSPISSLSGGPHPLISASVFERPSKYLQLDINSIGFILH
jgi:hypothetical protein